MESIYPPKSFNCTEKLTNINEYFKEFSKDCFGGKTIMETYQNLFGEDLKQFETISKDCNVDNLTVEHELTPIDIKTYSKSSLNSEKDLPEEAKNLNVVQIRINRERKKRGKSIDSNNINLLQEFKKTVDFTPGSELLITVRMHQPYSSHTRNNNLETNYRSGYFKCSHEIIALGCQTLKDLKEKFVCDDNDDVKEEVGDIFTDESKSKNFKYINGSSLICMDDKLYVDAPNLDSIDYSVVIKKWVEEKRFNLDFISEKMDDVELSNLNFRLGYPYLYQHNGDCEHLFVFSDIKLAKKTDSLCYQDYPYHKSINRYTLKCCHFCKKMPGKWFCRNNPRTVYDQTYFCQDCLVSYNYIDRKKVGDFKLYPL